jgi:programmed cell death protein 5
LTPEASERLGNVSLVKPDKARQVESYLIKAAQTGQLTGKVSEDQLKDILVQVTAQTQQKMKVTISRRRDFDDDDDDDDDEGW